MDRAFETRWPTLLLALALAAVPAGLAAALGALPAVRPGAESGWFTSSFALAVIGAAAVAALASLVPALRRGSLRRLLQAGASATLASGAVALLAGAESLAISALAAAAMALGAEVAGERRIRDRPMERIGGAVAVMVAAEAVAIVSLLVGAAAAPAASIVAWVAAAGWLAAAVLARGIAVVGAAVTAAGVAALALDRAGSLESAVGLGTMAAAQLLMVVAARERAEPDVTDDEPLPDLAARLRDAVLRFDGHLRLREWNEPAAELLALDASAAGTRIDDLLGVSLAELPGAPGSTVIHRAVGGLEVAMHRSGSGVVTVISDSGFPPEADRLGEELRDTIEELLRARRTIDLQRGELERSATVDPLTGVASRGAILERLRIEVAQARRYRHPLAVVQLDVDRFGDVNARHGIGGGDAVLREVALRIRLRVREADALGRCGSDGFLAALPHTDEFGAATFAEALRRRLAQRPIRVGADQLRITVSVGVATMTPGEDLDLDGLLTRAQEALDSARIAGGNRISFDRLHGFARLEPREPDEEAPAEPDAG